LPRLSWASALGAVLASVAVAGCGDSGSEPSADTVLRIYVSLPDDGDGLDAADGARLALAEAGGEAGGVTVEAEFLDDGGGTPVKVGENARAATQDSTAIAYLGDFTSGATRTSLPITNTAGMLQVSPSASASDLVEDLPGSDEVPRVQSSGSRTFGRVIPSDEAQGRAAAAWVDEMDLDGVALTVDESPYGKVVASGFREALARTAISDTGDLDFYAGVGRASDAGPVMVTDAQLTPESLPDLGSGTLATSAALDPSQLPPVAHEFVGRFIVEYDRTPGRYAAYGYEAMAVILDAIDRASDPTDRAAVVDALFDTADRESILGLYSITSRGETTYDNMTGYEVVEGGLKPVQALGFD
jgi:branched-chain amino acid transport system substrate-binding protein